MFLNNLCLQRFHHVSVVHIRRLDSYRKKPGFGRYAWAASSDIFQKHMMLSSHTITWVWPPPRMPVTTRMITFLGGDTHSFPTLTGLGGPHQNDNLLFLVPIKTNSSKLKKKSRKRLFCAPEKDIGPGSNFNQYGRSSPADLWQPRSLGKLSSSQNTITVVHLISSWYHT